MEVGVRVPVGEGVMEGTEVRDGAGEAVDVGGSAVGVGEAATQDESTNIKTSTGQPRCPDRYELIDLITHLFYRVSPRM